MSEGIVVTAILTGRAVPFGPHGEPSAIAKQPVSGPVRITETGIDGDQQGDPRVHGGPEKALHHYPRDHYPVWAERHPVLAPRLAAPGAFGENLTTLGMTEADVCIGDIYRFGSALLQVSQARQPCWKLDRRFGLKGLARQVQDSGMAGWYYRVLEPGRAAPGDRLVATDRPHPGWPLSRLLQAIFIDRLDRATLGEIATLPALAPGWRRMAQRRLDSGTVEDWSKRLGE